MTVGILFVCTANICRSPMAQGVFRAMVRDAGLAAEFDIASAGTSAVRVGDPPSPLAMQAAAARGYDIADCRARHATAEMIEHSDLVLAMTRVHLAELRWLAARTLVGKPQLLMSYAPSAGVHDVSDPYGGSRRDYERALDLIETGCRGLLDQIGPRFRKAI